MIDLIDRYVTEKPGEFADDRRRILGLALLAAATARHELKGLSLLFSRTGRDFQPSEVEECLLQTLLFAGFPRTIEALKLFRSICGLPATKPVAGPVPRDRGEEICRRIYGGAYNSLLKHMEALHPDLKEWMIDMGYGQVLSRPGLDLPTRECCVLAVLMATGMHLQLKAHLRGARNLGLSRDGIVWLTNRLDPIIPPDSRKNILAVVTEFTDSTKSV